MSTQTIQSLEVQTPEGYLVSLSHSESEPVAIGPFLTLGRDSSNMIDISDPYVSSRHLPIETTNESCVLKDKRSRKGTFSHGARVRSDERR